MPENWVEREIVRQMRNLIEKEIVRLMRKIKAECTVYEASLIVFNDEINLTVRGLKTTEFILEINVYSLNKPAPVIEYAVRNGDRSFGNLGKFVCSSDLRFQFDIIYSFL